LIFISSSSPHVYFFSIPGAGKLQPNQSGCGQIYKAFFLNGDHFPPWTLSTVPPLHHNFLFTRVKLVFPYAKPFPLGPVIFQPSPRPEGGAELFRFTSTSNPHVCIGPRFFFAPQGGFLPLADNALLFLMSYPGFVRCIGPLQTPSCFFSLTSGPVTPRPAEGLKGSLSQPCCPICGVLCFWLSPPPCCVLVHLPTRCWHHKINPPPPRAAFHTSNQHISDFSLVHAPNGDICYQNYPVPTAGA